MKRITDIIKSAEKNSLVNYDLQRDHSLSQSYPEGETAYFKKRIFELKQQIAKDTLIGQNWTEGYCSKDILTNDWIEKHTQIALKYMNETEVFKQLETFMYQYFQLLSYEKLLKDISEERNITTMYAFYYCMRHRVHPSERSDFEKAKGKAIKNIVVKHGLKSEKNFELAYNRFTDKKPSEILTPRRTPILTESLKLCKDDPDVLKEAEEFLKQAK